MSVTPAQAIDAANEAFGRHARSRALHAKGTLLHGTFKATPEAAGLTRAVHMQGVQVPATFRFSNGSGNPHHPDSAPDPRGLAVKMYLPDGSRTDIVAVSTPVFPVATPEAFVELLRAQARPATVWRMPLFLARHPRVLRILPVAAASLRPPESYATIPYHGLHAYRWLGSDGGGRHVRYRLVPERPGGKLGSAEAKGRGADYLQEEIVGRIARGPVHFDLEVQIAEPGDPVDDPSRAWPESRERLIVGRFEITGLETEREKGDDVLVFDPTRVTDGIELSDDPILRFRRDAYGESVARRMGS